MAINPFGWINGSGKSINATNLESMHSQSGTYTDQLRSDVASGAAPLPTTVSIDSLGIHYPKSFGQFWFPKLAEAKAGTGKATVAFVGDSVTRGYYASKLAKGWASLLAAELQSYGGDGGSGYQSMLDTTPGMVSKSLTSGQAAFYDVGGTGEFITLTGTWSADSIGGVVLDGPGPFYLKNNGVGNTATAKVRGTTVKVFLINPGVSGQQVAVSIDGVSQGTVTLNSAAGVQVLSYTGLTATTHTVVLTVEANGGNYIYLCGFSGENTTGVVANNFGMAGQWSSGVNNVVGTNSPSSTQTLSGTFGPAGLWTGGPNYSADLIIYAYGLNDLGTNGTVTPDSFTKNLHEYLEGVQSSYSGSALGTADIMILNPVWGKFDATAKLGAEYSLRARALADHFGAAYVNFNPIARNSYAYWQGLGYFSGGPSNPGVAGSDNAHPSDTGHAYMASVLQPLIMP